jgi:TonB-dependent SusC/RagA subfamily outer membrane receptor
MKKSKKRFVRVKWLVNTLAVLLGFLFTVPAYAQTNVTGTVMGKDGVPLSAATITIKNKKINAVSSADGKFSIAANTGDVLVISSVGYDVYEVKIGNDKNIVANLSIKGGTLEDVVVIGYGTQRRKDLTGSVSAINMTESKKISTSDLSQLLQGRATGVAVNSDGQPGAVPSVRIRGFSTFGGSQPMYVVDGMPGVAVRDFSPNDIETITVLKDASAAAIYGAAAGNGVVIITTKQGRKNSALKVTYNGYVGNDKVWQLQDVTK